MILETLSNQRILFRALDWGMGHVSRSISILKQLQTQGNEFFIVGSRKQNELFQFYGIKAQFLEIEQTNWNFNGSGRKLSEGIRVVRTTLKIKKNATRLVEKLVEEFKIDLILSDHVYGFQSKTVYSIFITHQVELPRKTPKLAKKIHARWLNSFNFIWIVDAEKKRLAGELSTEILGKSNYIGLRSRFDTVKSEKINAINSLVVISGPKPYSSLFLMKILAAAAQTNSCIPIICPEEIRIPNRLAVYSSSNSEADNWFKSAELIISKTGYSTFMDCEIMKKKALLIATKGQVEQEYLAEINSTDQIECYSSKNEPEFFKRLEEIFKFQYHET